MKLKLSQKQPQNILTGQRIFWCGRNLQPLSCLNDQSDAVVVFAQRSLAVRKVLAAVVWRCAPWCAFQRSRLSPQSRSAWPCPSFYCLLRSMLVPALGSLCCHILLLELTLYHRCLDLSSVKKSSVDAKGSWYHSGFASSARGQWIKTQQTCSMRTALPDVSAWLRRSEFTVLPFFLRRTDSCCFTSLPNTRSRK